MRPLQLAMGIQLAEQRAPQALPRALLGPGAKAPPAGRRRTASAGHIPPRAAGLQHGEKTVERWAIVMPFAARAGFLLWDEGLEDSPLCSGDLVSAHAHN